jgi:DNA invertase Pin-like site-specific DNA recombinase
VPSILKLSAISRPHFHKGLHKVRPTVRDDLFPLIVIHELEFLRKDDVLVVTRLDRLARSMLDLQNIIKTLRDKGAWLRCTEQPIDMTTASGKAFLDMLGVFAEFENNLRRERQLEGIAKAKAAGVYTQGRPKSVDDEKIRLLHAGGKRVREIVKELKCSRASIYLAIEAPIAKPRIQPRAAA